jgi:hypothetical protein
MVRIGPRAGAGSGFVLGSRSERWGGRGKVNNDTILTKIKCSFHPSVIYAPAGCMKTKYVTVLRISVQANPKY